MANYIQLTAAGTTPILAGPGHLKGIIVGTAGDASSTVVLNDINSQPIVTLATDAVRVINLYDVDFASLTAVITAPTTAPKVTLLYDI